MSYNKKEAADVEQRSRRGAEALNNLAIIRPFLLSKDFQFPTSHFRESVIPSFSILLTVVPLFASMKPHTELLHMFSYSCFSHIHHSPTSFSVVDENPQLLI